MTPERVLHAEVKAAAYFALRRSYRAAAVPSRAMPDGMTVRVDTAPRTSRRSGLLWTA